MKDPRSAEFDWKPEPLSIKQKRVYPLSLAWFIPLSPPLNWLVRLSARTWQQSFTSAAAEQLPAGVGPPMEQSLRSQGDFSPLECATKRKRSGTTGPRGIWLRTRGGGTAAHSESKHRGSSGANTGRASDTAGYSPLYLNIKCQPAVRQRLQLQVITLCCFTFLLVLFIPCSTFGCVPKNTN